MKLFIASTPYNLFNYINLKVNLFPNEDIDLIISNFDQRNKQYYNKLKQMNLFNNIYFIEQKGFEFNRLIPNKLKRFIKKVVCELRNRYNYNYYFKKYCSEMIYNKSYNEIYVDAFGFMPRFIFNHYYSINKELKVFKVDCGIESYYDMNEHNALSKKNNFMCNKIQKRLFGYYLYSKELANVGKYDVIELPKINVNDENFKKLINQVFEYKNENINFKQNEFLFLDQCLTDYKELDDIEQEIVDSLNKNLTGEYCVKLHPRTDEKSLRYKDVDKLKTYHTFEILCLNNPELLDSYIITPFSTAAILPKLLFDAEPKIICLTELFREKHIAAGLLTEFFERIRQSYKDKSKVIIIKDLNEFEVKLKQIQ